MNWQAYSGRVLGSSHKLECSRLLVTIQVVLLCSLPPCKFHTRYALPSIVGLFSGKFGGCFRDFMPMQRLQPKNNNPSSLTGGCPLVRSYYSLADNSDTINWSFSIWSACSWPVYFSLYSTRKGCPKWAEILHQ